jgi:hypothetical protein
VASGADQWEEHRVDIDLRLLATRSFAASSTLLFLTGLAMFGSDAAAPPSPPNLPSPWRVKA